MSIERTSSWTHHLSLDLATSEVMGEQLVTSSTTLDVAQALASSTETPANADDEAVLVLATEATAVGEDTLALTGIDVLVAAGDYGSIITADVLVLGAAIATDGEIAYTNTDASLQTGYANFMFLVAMDLTQTASDGSLSTSFSTSELNLLSVDGIGGPLPLDPSLAQEMPLSNQILDSGPVAATDEGPEWGLSLTDSSTNINLQGNLAIAEISAQAIGFDSFLDITADVLTVEDQLSMILTQLVIASG